MSRPVMLFTGQWADLTLEDVAKKASDWGYDGLELACWGDHFEVDRALSEDGYTQGRWDILNKYELKCAAISTHLVGQCVSDDPIDERHRSVLSDRLWGDGDPDGVRDRCAEEVKNTACAAAKFGVKVVNGFTGSPVWKNLYFFPPTSQDMIDRGYAEFARRWKPIMDVFAEVDVKFGLEVHPTEIAYDLITAQRTLDALDGHPNFCFNFDPSHFIHQFIDPVLFVDEFADRIVNMHVKDSRLQLTGRNSILSSHLDFGDSRRGWDFVSPGRGDVKWDPIIRALNRAGYQGPLTVEWEDSGMDREWGAPEALKMVRSMDYAPSQQAFDAAFAAKKDY
jgi:sugar phosphate isomerase/epimerase